MIFDRYISVKHFARVQKDRLCEAVAYALPKRVVYFCVVRAWAHYTIKHVHDECPAVTVSDTLKLYEKELHN